MQDYLQLFSSFPHGLPFLLAEPPPAAAWPAETSVRPGCSLCRCSAYPTNTRSKPIHHHKHKVRTVKWWCHKYSADKLYKSTPDPEFPYVLYINIKGISVTAAAALKRNRNEICRWMTKLTLYSKQDTQIVRSSSSLLSCEGGISIVQRWIRLLSAFFITHRKHTNRWRLVSAAKVATDLPCWEENRKKINKQWKTVCVALSLEHTNKHTCTQTEKLQFLP